MGRKSKYETNVEPFLKDIPNWLNELTEYQIAKKLNVSRRLIDKILLS